MVFVGLAQRRALATKLDLINSELSVPENLISGNTYVITVTAKDSGNNRINTGGDTINLKVTNECTVEGNTCTEVAGATPSLISFIDVTMTDDGNGIYSYSFNLFGHYGKITFTAYATGYGRGVSVDWYTNYNWATPVALSNVVNDLNYYWNGATDVIFGTTYVEASAYFNTDIIGPVTGSVTFYIEVNYLLKTTFTNEVVADGSLSSYTFKKYLVKGSRYSLNLKWNNQGGDATLKVYWSYSGQDQIIIPNSNYATIISGILGSSTKEMHRCGDGYRTGPEECDDGNFADGNG